MRRISTPSAADIFLHRSIFSDLIRRLARAREAASLIFCGVSSGNPLEMGVRDRTLDGARLSI